MKIIPEEKYSVYEAARLLGFSPKTIYNYIEFGQLDYMLTSTGSIRIYGMSLLAFEKTSIIRARQRSNYTPCEYDIQPSLF